VTLHTRIHTTGQQAVLTNWVQLTHTQVRSSFFLQGWERTGGAERHGMLADRHNPVYWFTVATTTSRHLRLHISESRHTRALQGRKLRQQRVVVRKWD
jgi:hypothetical protein